MKLKYYFYFYKYIFICILCFLLGNIGFVTTTILVQNKAIKLIFTILSIAGIFFFLWRIILLLQWMPQHFREYYKTCKMIEENKSNGTAIKKSDLYLLGSTRCGEQLLKAVTDKYDIKL